MDGADGETLAKENYGPLLAWSDGLNSEAIGNLAHELRTPLQVMLGLLDILRDEGAEQSLARRREILDRMSINAFELEQTIDNLMVYVLTRAGASGGLDENLTLESIIADITPALEAANQRKGLDVRFDFARAPKIIRAPRRTIIRILLNLALNAIKFTKSGSVTIGISHLSNKGPGLIELRVSDSGPGLSPEQLDEISKPFAQLSRSPARLHRGIGLGLAIVREHAESLGGKLVLRAGAGATFIVRFPARGAQLNFVAPTHTRAAGDLLRSHSRISPAPATQPRR
jgi:two-component system sensor histidine kinase/response regulator